MTVNHNNSTHTPVRSCCACRKQGSPGQFLRVTCSATDGLQLDETFKRPGRGAYLCPCSACIEQALKKGSLARSLHLPLTAKQTTLLLQQCLTRISENTDAEK